MKFNRVLVVVFLFTVQFATSQITGKIQDTADNYPLEYVAAALYNQLDRTLVTGVITDIDGVDFEIGRLRKPLEKKGIADNTVIILMGDNVQFLGE